MKITVKTLVGKTTILDVGSYESIESVKEKIHNKEGIPQNQQRLPFERKPIENGRTLHDYDIKDNSTIHLIFSLANFSSLSSSAPVYEESKVRLLI